MFSASGLRVQGFGFEGLGLKALWVLGITSPCILEMCMAHPGAPVFWVLVKGFNLSYHTEEALLFTFLDPYSGILDSTPEQEPGLASKARLVSRTRHPLALTSLRTFWPTTACVLAP